MKKLNYLGFLLVALIFSAVGVKAMTITEDLKLDKDLTEAIVVEKGKTVTIDLNGHNITLTQSGVDAISNYGTLTIKGSGVITAAGAAVINYPGATATLDNGEYLSTGWYTIKNMGTMTINNMKFGNNVNNGSSLIVNGYYGSSANDRGQTEADTVMMTINGGTFENKNNSCNVVKNDDYGKLVINDGTFIANSNAEDNANPVVQNWHKATINGGTFTSKNGIVLANGYLDATTDAGEFTINDGTFTGKTGIFGTNGGAKAGNGVLTIKGGTFYGDATVSTKYTTIIEGGVFDDKNVEANTEEGYDKYEVITDNDEEKYVVVKEEDLEFFTFSAAVEKEEFEEEEVALIEKEIKDKYTLASYYGVVVLASTPEEEVVDPKIEETVEPVEVKLELPQDLPKVKEGFTRKYYVIRVHNGEVTVIEDVKDNGDGTVSFKSDKFSTYALAYNDVEKTVTPPKTFDGITIYMILAAISVALVAVVSLKLKHRFN